MTAEVDPDQSSGRYRILGSLFRLTGPGILVELLDQLYCDFAVSSEPSGADITFRAVERKDRPSYFDLWVGLEDGVEELVLSGHHYDRVVMNVIAHFNAEALRFADLLTVHAGVVGLGGRAVAFPASSGSGKSTLTAACAERGFDYVSDEALCIDWVSHEVVPYPKPLWLSRWSRDSLGVGDDRLGFYSPRYEEAVVAPASLCWSVATVPLQLTDVVRIKAPGGSTSLEPLPASQTAMLLLEHSFYGDQVARAFRLVSGTARRSHAWELDVGDPTEAADHLFKMMSTSA